MGSRDTRQTQTQSGSTGYQGSFQSYGQTPEEQSLAEWTPNKALLDAGTQASFGAARQGITEGADGYSGITNPVAAARMKEVGLQELADRESSALTAANRDFNQQDLQRKQFLASLRRPQYIQSGTTTSGNTVTTLPQQSLLSSILGSGISGGLGLAAAFA
jgi:hypothetical protein